MNQIDVNDILNEFERFVAVAPDMSAYVPEYIKQKMIKIKSSYQELIDFIEEKSSIKCYYWNKYEFIDSDKRDGRLFFSKQKLITRIEETFRNTKYYNRKDIKWATEYYYKHFVDESDTDAYANYTFLPIIIITDCNKELLCETTVFHELCHCLQRIYDNDFYKEIRIYESLLKKAKREEDKIVWSKKLFLHKYVQETQANLFGSFAALIHNYENLNLQNLEKIILHNSLFSAAKDGYFEFPILEKKIATIEKNPEFLKQFFIQGEDGRLDYEKLYGYTREKVLKKQQEYSQELLENNKNIDDIIIEYYSEKPRYLLYFFDLVIYRFRQDIHKKQLKLAYYEEKLQVFKQNFSEKDFNRLNASFNMLVDKLRNNGIFDKYEYYTRQVSQLVQKQGNSKIYFFVKTDYLNGDKIDEDKLNQDLNGLEFKNLKQNILKHFETSRGQSLSYYSTDDNGKIHFTDFVVFAEHNDLKVIFHELCHSLQHSFNNSRKPINMNKKQEFLYYYDVETQADLFSYLLYILDKINDKYDIDFDKILFESAERNGLDGYFSFPILKELIDKEIQVDLQKFLDKFKTENEIDIKKLFYFVVEKVQVKRQIYAKFVLNENIDFGTLISYFCAKKNEKTKFSDIYKHSQLEEDLRNNETYRKEYQGKLLQKCVNNLHINELNELAK